MPQIPEWAANLAVTIFNKSAFKATELIGQQQLANGTPLAPGASKVALKQLLEAKKLMITPEGKIDITLSPAKSA
ncbi:MAG: hypothetical protein NTZ93_04640 [Candidatus Beckwithbacteria bacterium]|nr:hypothetical protein [Candidatus Beckwithbacteria bacterium]